MNSTETITIATKNHDDGRFVSTDNITPWVYFSFNEAIPSLAGEICTGCTCLVG